MIKYNDKFFVWLKSIDKLDLWEALLDTIEDFNDITHNLRANDEISKIEKKYEEFDIREERKKKLEKINNTIRNERKINK